MFINHKGIKLYYNDSGQGNSIILLHGFLESSTMWKDLESSLSKSYRIISPDLLGHGKSDCIDYIHTMEDMADGVLTIIDYLKIDKVTLIGHSMGGYVSLALAEKYPTLINGLCLVNSTASEDSPQRIKNRNRAIKQVKIHSSRFIKLSLKNLFRPKNRIIYKDEIKEIQKEACQMSTQGIVAALEGMKLRPNREGILKNKSRNALIIASKKDPVINYEELHELANRHSVKLISLSDGHMSHIENKSDLSYIIKQYVEKLNF